MVPNARRSSVDFSGVTFVRSIRCSKLFPVCSISAGAQGRGRRSAFSACRACAGGVARTAVRHAMRAASPQRAAVRGGRPALPGFADQRPDRMAGRTARSDRRTRAGTAAHRPADAWSLQRLAREIGVSRSSLAERFTGLIGQPPMRYLARWRIQLACRLLVRRHGESLDCRARRRLPLGSRVQPRVQDAGGRLAGQLATATAGAFPPIRRRSER